jgi:4-amino-4-deoxy-L-arabinose transferase-like glycosyltransferase
MRARGWAVAAGLRSDVLKSRNPWRDLLLLTALCWGIYCIGPTTHGLTNWQEAQRALVAREMQSRGDWIVPAVDGRPYLAKPPMIYWAQLALAEGRGARTGEFELRLTVALAGWIGVMATYVVGRRFESAFISGGAHAGEVRCHGEGEASWWAALFLATGILYTRSSRIGELDILLVPFTVVAVGAVHAAWRAHLDHRRTSFAAVMIAVLAAAGAMLTKGPPGLLAIGLGAYGGMALWSTQERRPRARLGVLLAAAVLGVALPLIALLLNRPLGLSWERIIGVLLFGLIGVGVGGFIAEALQPKAAAATLKAFARTHPVAVLGLPFLALWGWGQLVASRVGREALDSAVRAETADNLRALVLESPFRNLTAAGFGVGLGGVMAAAALVWIVRRRVRLTPELAILVVWVVGGLIAFSVLGKGVGRYLTPVWPGIALLGGVWWARMVAEAPWGRSARRVALAAVISLAVAQGWWYAWGLEWRNPHRSPRAMLAELLNQPGVDADRLATVGFDHPAINFYAGRSVPAFDIPTAGSARVVEEMQGRTLLLRESELNGGFADLLGGRGTELRPIPLRSEFRIDNKKSRIVAAVIRPSEDGGASPPAPPAASDPQG